MQYFSFHLSFTAFIIEHMFLFVNTFLYFYLFIVAKQSFCTIVYAKVIVKNLRQALTVPIDIVQLQLPIFLG